jgi:hypothetical protein
MPNRVKPNTAQMGRVNKESGMRFHKDGTLPKGRQIFVFGSNLVGLHGAGAAKVALERFDAQMERGIGLVGMSYAIPTKDRRICTLPLSVIETHIKVFLDFAANCTDGFFVTRIGCGLAEYTDEQIAPLFRGAPANCSFAEEWRTWL